MNKKNKKKIVLLIDELNLGYKLIDVFNKLKINISLIIFDFSLKNKISQSLCKVYKMYFVSFDNNQDNNFYKILSKEKGSVFFLILIRSFISRRLVKLYYKNFYHISFYDMEKYRGKYAIIMPFINKDSYTTLSLNQFSQNLESFYVLKKLEIKISKNDLANILFNKSFKCLFSLLYNTHDLIYNKSKHIKKKIDNGNIKQVTQLPNNGFINWNWYGKYIVKFVKNLNYFNFNVYFRFGSNTYSIEELEFKKKKHTNIKNNKKIYNSDIKIPCRDGIIKVLKADLIENKIKNLIVFGTGGHAKSVTNAILSSGGSIDYFVDITNKKSFLGYNVYKEILNKDKKKIYNIVIAIGDNYKRNKVYKDIVSKYSNILFPVIISSNAKISQDVFLEEGTVVLQNAVIGSNTKIKKFCIINTSSSIDHDNQIGAFSSIAPNATLAGNVTLGSMVALGISTIVFQNINIRENTVVGSGSLVNSNLENNIVAYGKPAKKIRKRKKNSNYL